MEIVNEKAALLSNREVYTYLNELQSGKGFRKLSQQQQNLATVSYETVKYLEKTPCKYQSDHIIQNFLSKVKAFKLTKAEKLAVLNLRPTTEVEIQLLIEESEERLSQEQIEELLDLVNSTIPGDQLEPMDTEEGRGANS